MRRIALALALGALAAPAGAQASTHCSGITHHGYDAVGIVETGLGCDAAHGIARHVIVHGSSGFSHLHCSRSFLPHDVSEWTCSGLVHGEKVGVKFGVRRTFYSALEPTAPFQSCAAVSGFGYGAGNIREAGLGCPEAQAITRHVLGYWNSGHVNIRCTSRHDRNITYWHCDGQVGGHGIALTFTARQLDPRVA
jgi:hypothetical protein